MGSKRCYVQYLLIVVHKTETALNGKTLKVRIPNNTWQISPCIVHFTNRAGGARIILEAMV